MFIVTPSKANFNVLLGREWIHGMGAVPSIVHQKVFFWNDDEHLEVLDADQKEYETGMYFADQQITAAETPKAHLNGFIFSLYFLILSKDNFRCCM
uniref:Uncharacterized protein n=1 Tax=Cajanus cajan TaxID=3821 RepID=A0A151QRC2_CAJCA|nr:hypothetical protein KK1_046352 [Cajanus cajan]